jgi:hypothetical protein
LRLAEDREEWSQCKKACCSKIKIKGIFKRQKELSKIILINI